jgi:hypothetical protein
MAPVIDYLVIIWFRTRLDREMYDNALCCTYPEECSGQHSPDISLPRSEATVLWKILQVREARYGIL